MNAKTLKALEYEKIVGLLSDEASSQLGKAVIWELLPFTDMRQIRDSLDETDEAVRLITFKGSLPLGNIYDISKELSLAKKGGTLSIGELLKVLYNMKVARDVKSFMAGDTPDVPILKSMTDALEHFKELLKDLDNAIKSEDRLSDNASSELGSIRRSIVRKNEDIRVKINHIISSAENKNALQDAIVTVRGGRYVIPVKQEYKGKINGIIHDQSGSGATVFIEPQIIVNMNNELRELELAEKAEEAKIIGEFSSRVGELSDRLKNNDIILVDMDVIMAKGKLSVKNGFERPNISSDRSLNLKNARHPLIDRKKAAPINIRLDDEFTALIITGPNTGGKTVSLKMTGLLSLMMQSGLHIPASAASTLPVYDKIFADIGDEQSIEQSLSTFSSHMKNIVAIVDEVDENSLVLLDELGAGTDPAEGAALAIAILDNLRAENSHVIATTHYTEIKKYAIKTDGVENASMNFDIETLSPTYSLSIGVAGKSNAFEISQKLGLRADIIESARGLLTSEDIAFEEVLKAIEDDKNRAEAERDEAIMLNIRVQQLQRKIEEDEKRGREEREKLLEEAKRQARDILKEAKQAAKQVQDELKEIAKLESLGERNKRLEKSKKKIKDTAGKYKEQFIVEENDNPISIDDVKIGDRVKVLTINQNGEIIGMPDSKGELLVQVGIIKMKCKAKDLKVILEGRNKKKLKQKSKSGYGSLYRAKTSSISQNVNVQGENLADALAIVEKYIDDAFMANLREVTVIHGRGEGILKNGIWEMLKKNGQVKEFRAGSYNEGGHGVTIVSLKE